MSVPAKLKDKLLVEACHVCVICGSSGVQVHHIDGNEENNDETNLIVLCLPHHDEAEKSKKARGLSANLTTEQLRRYKEKQKQELFYKKRVEKGVDLELLLPLPPMPYFAHPYPLQENFTGRSSERKELTDWFTNDDKPMFAYVAIGGMGKSALTWYWLHEDIIKNGLAPEGIIWWSFYDREARFETFLMKAIQYASEGKIDAKEIPSTRDRMDVLYKFLCEKHFLLVLDGVERVLRAYAGLGSPYQGDEVKKDEKDFRACIEPNAGIFLQW
ncbi:HNH endonuclease [bacterium]|nr:HNH endonuclease [bacterium]